jgi:hypothetical protein
MDQMNRSISKTCFQRKVALEELEDRKRKMTSFPAVIRAKNQQIKPRLLPSLGKQGNRGLLRHQKSKSHQDSLESPDKRSQSLKKRLKRTIKMMKGENILKHVKRSLPCIRLQDNLSEKLKSLKNPLNLKNPKSLKNLKNRKKLKTIKRRNNLKCQWNLQKEKDLESNIQHDQKAMLNNLQKVAQALLFLKIK